MNKKVIYAIVAIVIVLVVSYYSIKYKEGAVSTSHSSAVHSSASVGSSNNGSVGGSSKPTCFSADSILYLENGETKQIQNAKLGDKILSYNLKKNEYKFSPIIAIPHEKNSQVAEFIQINNSIKITKTHLLPVLKKSANIFELINAYKIDIGDIIISKSGNEIVESLTNIELEGIYSVVTQEEYIVVDNIVASPYAAFPNLANIYYSLFRNLYNISPTIIKSNMYEKFNESSHAFYLNVYTSLVN
jgi:hypothetical protein